MTARPLKVAVVGGGLAGLTAGIELLDAGTDVTLYEARPTLGGAVQTLPERDDDPKPPPDNGQHIALGGFTEYLRFLARVGEGNSYLRKRLALPVLDEQARRADIAPSLPAPLRYAQPPLRHRRRIPVVTCPRPRPHGRGEAGRDVRQRASPARRLRSRRRPLLGRLHPARAQPPRGRS